MIFIDFIKKTLRWLWPSLVIIIFSCVRKSVFESLTFEQIQDGLLLYAGYLLCIVPIGSLLLKTKWFDDESKAALLILFLTYVFFEYAIVFSTWERFAGYWVERFFFNKQHSVFIFVLIVFGIGLIWILRMLNDKRKNWGILIFTMLILAIGQFVDIMMVPDYKFNSDLFDIKQSDITVNKANIPRRIFWIILDEHPSSLILNEAWGYKDTTFRKGLESLGFTVYDSCVSNYNFTPFSIAATTYGAMLPVNGPQFISIRQWNLLRERICTSPVMTFFRAQKYDIHNLSLFDSGFKKYYTYQEEIIPTSIVGMLISKLDNDQDMSLVSYNRDIIDSLTSLFNVAINDEGRFFTYAHLLMPHSPYLPLGIDVKQRKISLFKSIDNLAFLKHLEYTDSTIIRLLHKWLDNLSPEQRSNTLMIIQADHGPRFLKNNKKGIRWRPSFGILNAVLWPKKTKGKFYDGMSSVNTFRILYRDIWKVKLDILKDSTVNVSPVFFSENK